MLKSVLASGLPDAKQQPADIFLHFKIFYRTEL